MRGELFIAALTALLALGSLARADEGEPVRAMTYNIRLDVESDGANAWPHRRAAVAALIRFYAPDILGLQEALLHQRDQLGEDLPDYALLGVGRDDGKEAGEFSPLAIRRTKFEIGETGTFWLSPTPDRPSKGWDAALPRIVTWARLRERASGTALLALNTHWDHRGFIARTESARLIRTWIAAHKAPCESLVLLGDLNAPPSEASYRALIAPGTPALVDTRSLVAELFGPVGTFNGFDIMSAEPEPIDHVFVGDGVRAVRHGVITQHEEGRLPSDHYPVLVDLVLPDGGGCQTD